MPIFAIEAYSHLKEFMLRLTLRNIIDKTANPVGKRMFFIGLLFGLAIIVLSPPMTTPDELGHYSKAYSLTSLEVIPQPIPDDVKTKQNVIGPRHFGGSLPKEMLRLYDIAYDCFYKDPYPGTTYPWKELAGIQHYSEEVFSPWGGMTSYPPIGYLPQAAGIAIGKLFRLPDLGLFYLSRLFNLITYLIICLFALNLYPYKKWAVFILALNPMSLYLAASVSCDALLIAISFLFISILLHMCELSNPVSLRLIVFQIILLVLLTMLKPNMIILGLLLFLIPKHILSTKRKAFLAPGALAASLVGYFSWATMIVSLDEIMTPDFGSVSDKIAFFLQQPRPFFASLASDFLAGAQGDYILRGTIGYFGYHDAPVGFHWIIVYILVLLVAALYQIGRLENEDKNISIIMYKPHSLMLIGVTMILFIVTTFAAIYLTWDIVASTIIYGVQGRYFIPLMFVVLLFFVNDKPVFSLSPKVIGRISTTGVLVVLFFALITLIQRFSFPF